MRQLQFLNQSFDYFKEFKQLQTDINLGSYNRVHSLNNTILDASLNLGKVYACERDLEIEGKPYFDWDFARLELLAQASYQTEIKNQLYNFTNGKQTIFPIK